MYEISQRSHFWLRVAGLTLILVAEFGPRLWSGASQVWAQPAPARVASVTSSR
jgi:hypothetical protein